ncbi:AMP-binding protein [Clavibacter tessellarius]|uniref:AMP-binding protein n=1 Tax=Clavibacter tessellarius TaxID=31965 RepID=UPI0039E91F1D
MSGTETDPVFAEILSSALPGGEGADGIDPDAPLSLLGLTSLGCLHLGWRMGEAYGIPLGAFTERAFRNARSLAAFVAEHRAREGASAPSGPPEPSSARRQEMRDAGPRDLADVFRASALRRPDAVAVIEGTAEVTYGRLLQDATALARTLVGHARIGVLGERGALTYRAYLAALLAGAAVVPLAAEDPVERTARIVADAGVTVVVHALDAHPDDLGRLAGRLPGLRILSAAHGATVGGDSTTDGALAVTPDAAGDVGAPVGPLPGARIAYVIHTSGSTGAPKGVPVSHSSVLAFLRASASVVPRDEHDVFAQVHALAFDFSVFELWGAWAVGAAVLVVPRPAAATLGSDAGARRPTVVCCTPSLLELAAAAGTLAPGSLPHVRHIVVGGEPLRWRTVRIAARAAPGACITNVYGPTEATVWAVTHRLPPGGAVEGETEADRGIVPLGLPSSGVEARVDPSGELLLRGPQVFDGYAESGSPERPSPSRPFAERGGLRWYRTGDNVEVDACGALRFRGRIDGQVKVRGHRVELGEVEAAATRLLVGADDGTVPDAVSRDDVSGGEARCIAVAVDSDGPDAHVVLVIAASDSDSRIDPEAVRVRLAHALPAYMAPRRCIRVATLPVTSSGKVDRRELARIVVARQEGDAPAADPR